MWYIYSVFMAQSQKGTAGAVAQGIEHWFPKPCVAGSIPVGPTYQNSWKIHWLCSSSSWIVNSLNDIDDDFDDVGLISILFCGTNCVSNTFFTTPNMGAVTCEYVSNVTITELCPNNSATILGCIPDLCVPCGN